MELRAEKLDIGGIPAVLYGEKSDRVWLFVHGRCGRKEEARAFAELAVPANAQVLAADLPQHGERAGGRESFDPWTAAPELRAILAFMKPRWGDISVRANSIGAYFSMLAFGGEPLRRALFVSPVADMEKLILSSMERAGVSERELRGRGEIPTNAGETLSWRYLSWVRANPPADWRCPTFVLWGERDDLTSRGVIEAFARAYGADLAVAADGEHWFHTPAQLQTLAAWEREHLG